MSGANSDAAVYYSKLFPHETACGLLGRTWRGKDSLPLRELCIETADGCYMRWKSVSSPAELKQLFASVATLKFHTGAIYNEEPCHRKKIHDMHAKVREFVVDIDVNDYANSGVDADDVEACDAAWPIVGFGMMVLKAIMRKHFGFQNMLLVYSGRRGAHLSVHDARACELTDEARAAIVSYMQPSGHTEGGRPKYGRMLSGSLFDWVYKDYLLPFWTGHCIKPREDGGMGMLDTPQDKNDFLALFGNSYASRTLVLSSMSGAEAWRELCDFASKGQYAESSTRALRETVMSYVWPRLDANVSRQRQHLSKAWFSLHPKTGRLCMPVFGDPSSFEPSACPTLVGVVSGDAQETRLFKQGLAGFKLFLKKLRSSETEKWEPPRLELRAGSSFSMVGSKRTREEANADPLANQLMFLDRSRICYNLTRVFVAAACETDPARVKLYWYTKLLGAGEDDAVIRVFPGYSPPFRTPCAFPHESFREAARKATSSPGTEIVCTEAYVCVLLHPRHTDLAAAKQRLSRLEERLLEGTELCEVNSAWDGEAIDSMIASMARGLWEVVHVHLD